MPHSPNTIQVALLFPSLAASYLLGSVPFGFVLAKLLKGVDLREVGSGNIGATNASRVLGRGWGIAVFFLDFAKGWLPAAGFAKLASGGSSVAVLCGAAAVCGHVWPIYLRFRGGKAVATGCGALVALDPLVFLAGGVLWLATLASTRYLGLASMIMGASFPVVALFRSRQGRYGLDVVLGAAALAGLILWRHRANMRRMARGEEPRFRFRRRGAAANVERSEG